MTRKSSSKVESLTLKPSDATIALKHAAVSKRPVFLWGGPGIGKSEILRQIAEGMGYRFVDIRLSQMDPTDLRGIPYPSADVDIDRAKMLIKEAFLEAVKNASDDFFTDLPVDAKASYLSAVAAQVMEENTKRVMRWSPPNFYESDPNIKTFYLFDEMNSAPQSIQAAAYQVVLDRKIGEFSIGPDDVVFAAGNRDTDRGVTFKMPTPLMNRFVHIEMRADFDDWQTWAIGAGIHPSVVGYLTWAKHELNQFEATSASRGFPTPRSWKFVSDLVKEEADLPNSVKLAMIVGAVGDGPAAKYIEYLDLQETLPNPSDILTGKLTKWNKTGEKDTGIEYALTFGLCYELREKYNEVKDNQQGEDWDRYIDMMDNFFMFIMENFKKEMVVLGARTILNNFKLKITPKGMKKSWKQFAKSYSALVLDNQ